MRRSTTDTWRRRDRGSASLAAVHTAMRFGCSGVGGWWQSQMAETHPTTVVAANAGTVAEQLPRRAHACHTVDGRELD